MSRQCGRACCTRLRGASKTPLAREPSRGVGLRFRLSHKVRAGGSQARSHASPSTVHQRAVSETGRPGEHLDGRKLARWRLQQPHFWGVTTARRCQQTRSRARKTARGLGHTTKSTNRSGGVVDPTRGARVRTDAAREQKSDRARRRLPLRALNDRDFEDVVVRNAHPPTRDREIWSALTAPDVIGRTR
jgi:hypothetical protein